MAPRALLIFIFVLGIISKGSASYIYVWEGFERELNWSSQGSSSATGRAMDKEHVSEGARSLKMFFRTTSETARAYFSQTRNQNWASFGSMVFDVYNPTDIEGLRIGVSLSTTSQYITHEALAPALKKGWNKNIRIDFHEHVFASSASDYEHTGILIGRGDIRSVNFVILPGQAAEGILHLDNVRLEKKGIIEIGPFTLNNTSDFTASTGNLDYIPPGMRVRQSDLVPLESFETGTTSNSTWIPEDSSVTIMPSGLYTSHGSTSLAVSYPALPYGKDLYWVGMENRLKGVKQLRLEVYNAGRSGSLSLNLLDSSWNLFQSSNKYLGHGWNTIIFDFTNRNEWDGEIINTAVLDDLSFVYLKLTSRDAGQLYFDGMSAGELTLAGAAQAGTTFQASYYPYKNLEIIADVRIEDVYYGNFLSDFRNAGPEIYAQAGSARWDAGNFRTSLLYRRKITAFDNPYSSWIDEDRLGRNILGFEMAGRIADIQIQSVAASRIEFETHNSRTPTGLGPENVLGLRLRRWFLPWLRVGSTYVAHGSKYDSGLGTLISGLPRRQETYGFDLDSYVGGKNKSLSWALEGSRTTGDRLPGRTNAPSDDPYHFALRVSPSWGRLQVRYYSRLTGYDSDTSFKSLKGNVRTQSLESTFSLEGLPGIRLLDKVPIYDRSLGNNLSLNIVNGSTKTRDWYRDSKGLHIPLSESRYTAFWIYNDVRSKPHFSYGMSQAEWADQWTENRSLSRGANFRLPLFLQITANAWWELETEWTRLISSGESGKDIVSDYGLRLEKTFRQSLLINTDLYWSRSENSWQGVWAPLEVHGKWRWEIRQALGSDTVIRLIYGEPALLGPDFGLQDTIHVYTLEIKSYF